MSGHQGRASAHQACTADASATCNTLTTQGSGSEAASSNAAWFATQHSITHTTRVNDRLPEAPWSDDCQNPGVPNTQINFHTLCVRALVVIFLFMPTTTTTAAAKPAAALASTIAPAALANTISSASLTAAALAAAFATATLTATVATTALTAA